MNRLKSIVLDYERRGFNVTIAFVDSVFKLIINWMRQELYMDLTTCAADFCVPRAKNAIRFVKKIVSLIKSESPFTRYPKLG